MHHIAYFYSIYGKTKTVNQFTSTGKVVQAGRRERRRTPRYSGPIIEFQFYCMSCLQSNTLCLKTHIFSCYSLNHCNIPRFSVVLVISAQHEAGLATKQQSMVLGISHFRTQGNGGPSVLFSLMLWIIYVNTYICIILWWIYRIVIVIS